LEVSAYLQERTWVGLTLQLGSSIIHPEIEMMFPMRISLGYLQPFRFTTFSADERQILEREVAELLNQSKTPANTARGAAFHPFLLESL